MALTNKLSAIGDAIREKTGKSDLLTLDAMPVEIASITTGGGGDITDEELTFSGSLNNAFAYNNWNWFLEKYKNRITFKDVSSAQSVFSSSSNLEDLSYFTIPVKQNTNIQSIFSGCNKLKKLPKVSGEIDRYIMNLFSSCHLLPSDEINNFFSDLTIYPQSTSTSYNGLFSGCYSVRNLYETLEWLHTNINTYTGSSTSFVGYNSWLSSCESLDTIENMPVLYSGTGAKTSNSFGSAFQYCRRLKDIMFKLNNGVPYVVKWKSQTIDLSLSFQIGWTSYSTNITNYNSGITKNKEVKDDATYQALKNDPDWFTTDARYSRYNHDSAVNTINSLPDTSAYLATAGGTNTIKFYGVSGELTDGGAINTLTEEEIAVAAAKGWTVTLS